MHRIALYMSVAFEQVASGWANVDEAKDYGADRSWGKQSACIGKEIIQIKFSVIYRSHDDDILSVVQHADGDIHLDTFPWALPTVSGGSQADLFMRSAIWIAAALAGLGVSMCNE